MNAGLIPARYATALFDFASGNGSVKQIYAEVRALQNSFSMHKSLKKAIDNPMLALSEKKKIIVLAAGGGLSPVFNAFIDLLLANGRGEFLHGVVLKFIDIYHKKHNIHVARLTTAVEVDAHTEARLASMVRKHTGGTLEIEKVVDPSLLGGFTFEVDFVRWDASLARQLQMIKKEYIEVNKIIA